MGKGSHRDGVTVPPGSGNVAPRTSGGERVNNKTWLACDDAGGLSVPETASSLVPAAYGDGPWHGLRSDG